MLNKVKLALRISSSAFDSELLDLIASAIADIRLVGAYFEAEEVKNLSNEVVDYTIENPLVRKAVITYCKLNFGQPDAYEQLKSSYDEQKAQMRECTQFKES